MAISIPCKSTAPGCQVFFAQMRLPKTAGLDPVRHWIWFCALQIRKRFRPGEICDWFSAVWQACVVKRIVGTSNFSRLGNPYDGRVVCNWPCVRPVFTPLKPCYVPVKEQEMRTARMQVCVYERPPSDRGYIFAVKQPNHHARLCNCGSWRGVIALIRAVCVSVQAVMKQTCAVAPARVGRANPDRITRIGIWIGSPRHLEVNGLPNGARQQHIPTVCVPGCFRFGGRVRIAFVGQEIVVICCVESGCATPLAQVVNACACLDAVFGAGQYREQQPRQYTDYGDHHQQLNQCKTALLQHAMPMA